MQYSVRRLHRVSGIPHVLKGLQYKKTRHRKSNVYCDAFSTMKTTNYYEQSYVSLHYRLTTNANPGGFLATQILLSFP